MRFSRFVHGAFALNPLVLAALLAGAGTAARAQTAPDAGSLLRESQQQKPQPQPVLPDAPPQRLLRDTGVTLVVRRFEITGATRVDNAELQARLADLLGQQLGFAQLQAAADRLAALYRERGLHATAVLPEQTLTQGVVRIAVIEGRLGKLKVESSVPSGRRLPLALAERMLGRGQVAGEVIDARALEAATLLANELPGIRVSVLLAAGANPGETDIVARIDERPLASGAVLLDNHDARATGAAKLGLALSLASPLGVGDDVQLLANINEGKRYLRTAFGMPLSDAGLRGVLSASVLRYRLVGEFKASGGEGRATSTGATLVVPLLRSEKTNLYGSANLEHKHLRSDSAAGNLSDKTDTALTLGLNGDRTDLVGGGGATVGGVQATAGKLDLGGNAADLAADQAGPRRNGHFVKLGANVARLQRVSTDANLWFSLAGQRARKNLDSGEKFSLGGASGVRAYPSLEGSGDHGWLATVELRYRLAPSVQGSVFYDHGQVTRERDPLPLAAQPNRYALKGAGIGLEWQLPGRVTLRALAASRIGSNPAAGANGRDSDGTKRRPQLWLSAAVPF